MQTGEIPIALEMFLGGGIILLLSPCSPQPPTLLTSTASLVMCNFCSWNTHTYQHHPDSMSIFPG